MKKIININLSGRVIPIEDSAYEKLQGYIDSLRRYFVNEEGRDEIINDIESRIAELMNNKVSKGASCVTDADVDEIIASMGRPEEFDTEAEAMDTKAGQDSDSTSHTYARRKSRGRLYRDSGDKFLGGVCSGIAAYLNVDPTIVRILFAIITFGGFGLGFVLYILLWIILPTKDMEGYSGKRFFRNPDDRVIGGVAGGLSAYLNKPTWVIRLIFAAPFIISAFLSIFGGYHWDFVFFPNIFFGSLGSTFAFIYIILWMLLPEARSDYDKMEMRGEKVDVHSIRQNVQEGMGNMKDRVKTWGEEVKTSAQNVGSRAKEFANARGKAFATEVGDTARRGGSGLGHAIGVLFKAFFLFIAGTIAFALFVALLALLFGGIAWWPVNNFLWTSNWQQLYAWGTLIFFLVVPLVAIITWVVRRLLRVRSRHSYLGWVFGLLWTLGWVCATLLAVSVSKDFREYEHSSETLTFNQPANNKLVLAVSAPELEYTGRFSWIGDSDEDGWDLTDDTLKLSTVHLNVISSHDAGYHVTIRRHSYGRTEEDAIERAKNIIYTAQVKDSVLDLGNGYAIGKADKFRGQQVEIEIKVPAGKKIQFDESVFRKLNPTGLKWKGRYTTTETVNGHVVRRRHYERYNYRYQSGVEYTMGIDGTLKDGAGNSITPSRSSDVKDYRYESGDTNRIQQQIEQREREIEELKKIKQEKTTTRRKTTGDKKDVAGTEPSPLFSVLLI